MENKRCTLPRRKPKIEWYDPTPKVYLTLILLGLKLFLVGGSGREDALENWQPFVSKSADSESSLENDFRGAKTENIQRTIKSEMTPDDTEKMRRLLEKRSVRQLVYDMEQSAPQQTTGYIYPDKFDLVQYPANHPMAGWAKRYRHGLQQWLKRSGSEEEAHAAYWEEIRKEREKEAQSKSARNESDIFTHGDTYGHHGKRLLQEEVSGDSFRPMRIVYETRELELADAPQAKIDFVKNEVLPAASDFWSRALSVVPVKGPLRIDRGELIDRTYCGHREFSPVPEEHYNVGVDNVDLILYVSATNGQFCGGNTLAVAVLCNRDGFDRPTAGAINICLDAVELERDNTASKATFRDNLDVMIHEIGHVIVLSSNHYLFFRFFDGTPRTARNFRRQTVTCVQGDRRDVIMPDRNTLDFFADDLGVRYAAIVTERVAQVTRNQFDCQRIMGAKLENQPTGVSCFGDHWDEKFGYSSTMSGFIAPDDNFLTPTTLALAEDSGWYLANYTLSRISPWGHGAGCDFFDGACLVPDDSGAASVPEYGRGFFCSDGSQRGCSPGHSHKMACTVVDWDQFFPPMPPPSEFQYFSNAPGRGGPMQVDFCPVYGSTYRGLATRELDCRDPENVDFVNFFDEYYGDDSMCVQSSTSGRCFRALCILREQVLKLQLNGKWHTCEYDFQELPIVSSAGSAFDGTVTCPRLAQACPDLICPVNCAGRGVCDFHNVEDGRIVPRCRCFNQSDTSPGCSASLVLLSANYIEDSEGLFDREEGPNFFDPGVAVFTDHPSTWSTDSWIWASGLFCLFLSALLFTCSSLYPSRSNTRRYQYRRRASQFY